MFVYEKDGAICITFKGSLPVETPEYTVKIDVEEGSLTVNDQKIEAKKPQSVDAVEQAPAVEQEPLQTVSVETPEVVAETEEVE